MSTIAIVTGASRGVGKGVARALGSRGATVYVTGRTRRGGGGELGGSIDETADEVTACGGRGVPVPCDHADDEAVAALFAQITAEQGRLDVLVNNVFAIPDGKLYDVPFWELPIASYDAMTAVGVRSHYVASVHAAKLMVPRRAGLIANISSFGAASYQVNAAYGIGKAAVDRMTRDTARDLRAHEVTVVSLWPGIVRTERLLAGQFPYSTAITESAELTGRAVGALLDDPQRMTKTGKAHVVAELAAEYKFTDIDGKTPVSLRRS